MSTITIPETDQKLRDAALSDVHDLVIDQEAMRAHIMQPAHTQRVVSSEGPNADESRPHVTAKPEITYSFDVKGFGDALHAALKDSTAGYVMRLRQNGTTIYTLEWNWAKRPQDGGEGWKPEVRMHVASCSKLITAIAMTKLLNEKQISYDAYIIDHLPSYWAKGIERK
jgi:CubicO group peptidase (beta-lactamase class C family)